MNGQITKVRQSNIKMGDHLVTTISFSLAEKLDELGKLGKFASSIRISKKIPNNDTSSFMGDYTIYIAIDHDNVKRTKYNAKTKHV